ncbi:MAG: MATE family efflux transporter [Alphaproteobacteria bacterium]|nr:MATE family efflux transporter [Alphaproteobacteria bacterium]
MNNRAARFLEGSIFRHVVVMTLTGALGLMTLFIVELADLYFLSLLKNEQITAAIGFAGTLDFANLSLCIGTGIAAVALVSRSVGAGNTQRAKEFATNAMIVAIVISAVYTLLVNIFIGPILGFLGATGETAHLAKLFVWTISPGFIFLAGSLSTSFSLRGIGDAKRAMYNTLTAALVTLALDPIFIFGLGWGIQGTAAANAIAYVMAFAVGLYGLGVQNRFLTRPSLALFKRDFPAVWGIALPSLIAQLATPFAAGYMTYVFAPFGDAVITGATVVNRVVPVAFGVIFSLSGAVGPIIGQNFGARNFPRVKRALRDGLAFAILYAAAMSLVLYLLRHKLIGAFHIEGRAAELVDFFCTWIAISWALLGGLFVASAAFNNLGKPVYSTLTNWGRATVGTIPFAMLGAALAGPETAPEGILIGISIGGGLFGLGSMWLAYALVAQVSGQPGGPVPNASAAPR